MEKPRLSPTLSEDQVKKIQDRELRKLLVRSIYWEDIEFEETKDYANDSVIFTIKPIKLRFSPHILEQEIPSAPDPISQAFAGVALALHEQEKERIRNGQ